MFPVCCPANGEGREFKESTTGISFAPANTLCHRGAGSVIDAKCFAHRDTGTKCTGSPFLFQTSSRVLPGKPISIKGFG